MASIPPPDDISEAAFAEALARYPALLKAVSETKSKPGQQTLAELDAFRFVTAPARFGQARGASTRAAMSLDEVKTLVAWKLKHGKFRPTLMKLVASNDAATVEQTVKEALAAYDGALAKAGGDDSPAVHAHASTVAVGVLSRLRGIGPATASLLVAVHYPQTAIFFSDEAYAWLCGRSGSGSSYQKPSKYNAKEYAALATAAADLMQRLGTSAQDIEQVAYVLINDGGSSSGQSDKKAEPKTGERKAKTTAPKAQPKTSKRKEPPTDAVPPGSRRSSRLRSG